MKLNLISEASISFMDFVRSGVTLQIDSFSLSFSHESVVQFIVFVLS
jgi:hypothetical protein